MTAAPVGFSAGFLLASLLHPSAPTRSTAAIRVSFFIPRIVQPKPRKPRFPLPDASGVALGGAGDGGEGLEAVVEAEAVEGGLEGALLLGEGGAEVGLAGDEGGGDAVELGVDE